MSEKEFNDFLKKNPEMTFDKKRSSIKQDNTNSQIKTKNENERDSIENLIKVKPSKYYNVKTYVYADGYASPLKTLEKHGDIKMVFDSYKEYCRWNELLLLQAAGIIKNLKRQQKILIQEGCQYRNEKLSPIYYKADFVYAKDNKTIVEDVKAVDKITGKIRATNDFWLKWKLLKMKYPSFNFVLI